MRQVSYLLSILILLTNTAVIAEEFELSDNPQYRYQLSIDTNKQTPFAGSDLSMSFIEAYRQIEDNINPPNSTLSNILLIIPRIIVSQYASAFQHEVFGHGARAREFDWDVISYHVNLNGSGSTHYLQPFNAHLQKQAMMAMGGMQATEVLSYKFRERFSDKKQINPVYGAAYFVSAFDQINYVLMTRYKGQGHDVRYYINDMNAMYGGNYITKSKMKKHTMLSLADPFLYFSLYALGTNQDFEYPMLHIGEDVEYLPGFRAEFTPYGIEDKFINYIRTSWSPIQVSLSQGKHKTGRSLKAQVTIDKILSKSDEFSIGLDLAIWKQPEILVPDVMKAHNKIGGMAEVKTTFNVNQNVGLYGAIGYKDLGFMIGQPLKESLLLRVGLVFDL